MREAGETCSVHRVARIMRENKLKAQIGYKRRYIKGDKLASVAENHLDRNFSPDAPNRAWVTVDPNLSRTVPEPEPNPGMCSAIAPPEN